MKYINYHISLWFSLGVSCKQAINVMCILNYFLQSTNNMYKYENILFTSYSSMIILKSILLQKYLSYFKNKMI